MLRQCACNRCGRRRPRLLVDHARIGIHLDGQWYCSMACVETTVRARIQGLPPVEPAYVQGWRAMRLGSLLMSQVGLTREAIDAVLSDSDLAGVPIGRALQTVGLVKPEDVLRALATQAGVRYLSSVNPRAVAHRPGALPDDVVRTLGIVPIAADAGRREMQVACAAPVPGLAVRALTRLTEWAVEPLLVNDDLMPQLVELYGSAKQTPASVLGFVGDRKSGPARVAQFAKRRRVVRMVQERCDPYVWVRLDGQGAVADVLMAMPEMQGGY